MAGKNKFQGYSPFLVAVHHAPAYADVVIKHVMGLGVKKVGVEISQ